MPPEPPKITLKLGRPTPTDVSSSRPNIPVPNGHIAQNGVSRNPFTGSSSNPPSNLNGMDKGRTTSAAGSPAPSQSIAMKNEMPARSSPAPPSGYGGHRTNSQSAVPPNSHSGAMLPPSTPGLANHNPYPQSSYAQSYNHHTNHASNTTFESKWRQPGKGRII